MCLRSLGFCLASIINSSFGQNTPTEAETLRSLLSEVRQLRQALQTTTVTGQKIQITLYRLQIQVLAASRAAQRLDEARSKVAEAQRWRQHLTGQVESLENLQKNNEDQTVRASRETALVQSKKELEWRTTEEQQLRAIESEASGQLQAEQGKLNELQDSLERLGKSLAISTDQ